MNIVSNYQQVDNDLTGVVLARGNDVLADGMALAMGVDPDEYKSYAAAGKGRAIMPEEWLEAGQRRTTEAMLIMGDCEEPLRLLGLGDEAIGVLMVLGYWADCDYGMVLEYDALLEEWSLAQREDED